MGVVVSTGRGINIVRRYDSDCPITIVICWTDAYRATSFNLQALTINWKPLYGYGIFTGATDKESGW